MLRATAARWPAIVLLWAFVRLVCRLRGCVPESDRETQNEKGSEVETVSEEEQLKREKEWEEEEERRRKILEEEEGPMESWEDWGPDDHYDPDNEHDTSMDYGIGEDIFDKEERS